MGGRMDGSVVSSPHGAEISERSSELVLPGLGENDSQYPVREREIGVSEPRTATQTATTPPGAGSDSAKPASRSSEQGLANEEAAGSRGTALPGDRGPRNHEPPAQRPSFWRRIALGRRHAESNSPPQPASRERNPSALSPRKAQVAVHHESGLTTNDARDSRAVEMRIVEPLLQALVSVEAKLERSHSELVGRSDQVEQRLTQLWDIEEQLGALGELQESLLQVSEQQRRLESAIVSQNKTLRWLVGAVFLSLAVAAFVVAAVLQ